MTAKHILMQTYQLLLLLNFTYTYVLLAANLDDFRSVAKKFIPDNLANQLTALASQNSKHSQQMKTKDEIYSEYSDEVEERISSVQLTTPKKRFVIKNQEHSLDLEELVERVRQKLEEKYKNKIKSETNKTYISNEESRETVRPGKKTVKQNIGKVKTTTDETQIYDEETKPLKEDLEVKGKENDGMFFKEEDLTKTKDSYEDYITPNKDDIFESDAETTKALKERVRENLPSYINNKPNAKENIKRLDDLEYNQSDEIKSQTRSIDNKVKLNVLSKENTGHFVDDSYDNQSEERKPQINNKDSVVKPKTEKYKEYDRELETKTIDNPVKLNEKNNRDRIDQEYDSRSEDLEPQTKRTIDTGNKHGYKKLKGTMIPTREYFKMSSPNYYVKEAVPEKYDFNEPLPERDREPEDLKHFINPPARINKKVMLRGI